MVAYIAIALAFVIGFILRFRGWRWWTAFVVASFPVPIFVLGVVLLRLDGWEWWPVALVFGSIYGIGAAVLGVLLPHSCTRPESTTMPLRVLTVSPNRALERTPIGVAVRNRVISAPVHLIVRPYTSAQSLFRLPPVGATGDPDARACLDYSQPVYRADVHGCALWPPLMSNVKRVATERIEVSHEESDGLPLN